MAEERAPQKAPGGMSPEEVEELLQRPLLMRLACAKPDGHPYITVTWHEWRDGHFWLVVRERARWARYMRDDPRVSFVIDSERYIERVQGEGVAEVVEEPNLGGQWLEATRRMADRYGLDQAYVELTSNQPRWLFRIRPTRIRTWQGVGWARSYWVEGTGGVSYEEFLRANDPSDPWSMSKS